ncbi:DUF309 domain-containing protein [Bacillus sp. SD088]|uniref:DUF309 domain-containing protein n=1 Tax=Bacillus sp. SD088 TaxID=2782012 RepID=UPI001A97AF35|nr:DUF309 domain-containing protein [Bacillus sp. SD088]MBO0995338.1 DUF309 domain-containing protein [Bacillus sp. SD088]
MEYPLAYIKYLYYFHVDRDYFECHEVLEEYWKDHGMKRNSIWVGLIQVAVSYYHYRNGNRKGAKKLINRAIIILHNSQEEIEWLGIHYPEFIKIIKDSQDKMLKEQPYKAINFPIKDKNLYMICRIYSEKNSINWGNPDTNTPVQILLKHRWGRLTKNKNSV